MQDSVFLNMNASKVPPESAVSNPSYLSSHVHRIEHGPITPANASKASIGDTRKELESQYVLDSCPQFLPSDSPPPYAPPLPARSVSDTGNPSCAAPDTQLQQIPSKISSSDSKPAPGTISELSAQQGPISFAQKAYGETRHFLGGLINHPIESNKHFTILRHSHGVAFYHGSTTSVTFSIFSDASLPPDRTLWLQSRGWTGKTGMRTKALLRLHDDWLDVTPSVELHASQVDPVNERAWQRDIARFRQKGPAKVRDVHQLRETVMVRIPIEAGDGYFQLVLCRGKKKDILCNSPVFRVLSTSAKPSSIRGASLSTLPLELGAVILGSYARSVVEAVASPVTSAVENSIQPYQPSSVKTKAAKTAFSMSNVDDRVGTILQPQDQERQKSAAKMIERPDDLDQGPKAPCPMDFKGRGSLLPTEKQDSLQDLPTVNLTKVPDAFQEQLRGIYMCWARFYTTEETQKVIEGQYASQSPWYQSILSIQNVDHASMTRVNMSHITKRSIRLRVLEDIELPTQTKLQIRIMCFIRPEIEPPTGRSERELLEAREAVAEAAQLANSYDASYTQAVLDHPVWAPEASKRAESQKENIGLIDRTKSGISTARSQIQKAPLHLLGVRAPSAATRDQEIAVKGFYIGR